MIDYSVSALTVAGYEPYYMYRQKYNTGNLENSGYAKPGTECVYNVDIMDVKDVKGYIERAETLRERHENFWKK